MTFKESEKFIADWQKAQRKYWVMETGFLCLIALIAGYLIGVYA